MGKRSDERKRIVAIISRHAQECYDGLWVYDFDARDKPSKEELERHGRRLERLIGEILGHKEAEETK